MAPQHSVAWNQRDWGKSKCYKCQHLVESRHDVCLMFTTALKITSGFPIHIGQMHMVLVMFRPRSNVGIQNFGMWGMYNLAKAYRNIKNPFANRRDEDWEASNGHTKDTTRLFRGPWHNIVGEHNCAQPLRMWNRLCFHMFLQVSQIF